MAHARIVTVNELMARSAECQCSLTIKMLLTGINGHGTSVLVVHFISLGNIKVNSPNSINELLHAIKINFCVVRNLDSAQVIYRLDHAFCAIVKMRGIDFHDLPVVFHLGVAGNGDERRLLLTRIDASKNDRVRSITILARTPVCAKEKHIERIFVHIGINQSIEKASGDDAAVIQLAGNFGKPKTARDGTTQQHADKRTQNRTLDTLATPTLTRTLRITLSVVAAVYARTRF